MSTAMEIAARELEKLIKAANTPTNLFDELAGEGRTTETVKGNADAIAAHKADLVKESMVVLIPSDYPTLQEAIDALSNKFPAKDVMIELRMESGFQPSSGISITYRDCSHFRITSEDPVVTVANDFSGDFIRAEYYARAPILATIVEMIDKGSDGYHISQQSTGFVEQNCGIRNAGMRGLYVNEASIVQARRSEFTGCNERNVWVTRGSTLSADTSNFSANKGGDNAVYISRGSTAYISYSTITNAFKNAITGVRSLIVCEQCDVSGAAGDGLNVSICHVSAKFMNARNCANDGFFIQDASIVDVRESDCSGCGRNGLYAIRSSNVNALGLVAENCGGVGIYASESANINARNAISKNNATIDVRTAWGAFISLNGAQTTNSTGSAPVASDCIPPNFNNVSSSGIIFA